MLFTGIENIGVEKYWLWFGGGVSPKTRLSAIISKHRLRSRTEPCRHNFVSRHLGFVIGHFRGESGRTDIKTGCVFKTPNDVG